MNSKVRKPKLAHVATLAHVSIGTASDALRDNGRVSEDTRKHVLAAAEKLGYRPHAGARGLAQGNSRIVALVIDEQLDEVRRRTYWPRLQAAFSERLFQAGVVATTLRVSDMSQLDGLPFDLIVYGGLHTDDSLPEGIRSSYRVVDVGITGRDGLSQVLRSEYERLCSLALDRLAELGAAHPGLLVSANTDLPVEPAIEHYRTWCADKQLEPHVVELTEDPEHTESVAATVRDGADGMLSLMIDPWWLSDQLPSLEGPRPSCKGEHGECQCGTVTTVPVIALDAGAAERPANDSISLLSIDGQNLGTQVAEKALAALKGTRAKPLSIPWTLNGKPMQPRD